MKKQVVAAGFFLFSLISPVKTLAADFTQFFVFGDSLADTGNVFNITQALPSGPIPPSPPYFEGRFSNGEIWVDFLGDEIGLTPTLSTNLSNTTPIEGINFAFGGANSGLDNAFIPGTSGILSQVSLFTQSLHSNNQSANPNALYAVWGGANDYIFNQNSDVSQVVANLLDAIETLSQVGAQNILVFNLPDLGQIPLILEPETSSNLTTLTNIHNAALTNALGQLSNTPGINIIPVDVSSLFNTVVANFSEFGFTDVNSSCVVYDILTNQIESECDNPNDFLFFDEVHPSTNAHRLVAQTALTAIQAQSVPEPTAGFGMLALLGLGAASMLKQKSKNLLTKI
jgi:phospholipase/lecithinase/hemolysin